NSSHALTFPGGNKGSTPVDARVHRAKQEIDWMEYHLKAMGSPFPVCQIKDGPKRDGGGIRVGFTVKSPVPITNA
ncbi:hypothetical protein RF158_11415, partial [Escherichia coli]|uniref:hypothetical protein n=1 Tax=Escherichia coli TaxID=562 RepID=UPI002814583B